MSREWNLKLPVMCLILVCISNCFSQQVEKRPLTQANEGPTQALPGKVNRFQFPRVEVSLSADGKFFRNVTSIFLRTESESLMLLLANSRVVEVLGLVDDQKELLNAYMKQLRNSDPSRKNIEKFLEDVFLPQQLKTLYTIRNRYRFAAFGTVNVIRQKDFFESGALSDRQIKNIESRLARIRDQYLRASVRYHEKLRSTIDSILSAEQVLGLKRELGQKYPVGSEILELFLMQCSQRAPLGAYSNVVEELRMLAEMNAWYLEFDGTMASGKAPLPDEMIRKLVVLCNQVGIRGISSAELDQLSHNTIQKFSKFSMGMREMVMNGTIDQEAAKKQFRDYGNELVSEIVKFFADRLSPEERSKISAAAMTVTLYGEGILFALIHGSLRARLELSDFQKHNLEKAGKELAEEIRSFLRNAETEVFQAIREQLSDRQQLEFNAKFDDRIVDVLPNIPLFLIEGCNGG